MNSRKKPIKKTSKKPSTSPPSTKTPYISNKDFYKELMACQKRKKMSNELGRMFIMLATKYSGHWRFANYTYRDELIATGIKACCEAFMKFNCNKSHNPFAFFTQVIHNSFLQVLNKEKRSQRIRDQLLVDANMNPSNSYLEFLEEEGAFEGDPEAREEAKSLSAKLGVPAHEFSEEEGGELDT